MPENEDLEIPEHLALLLRSMEMVMHVAGSAPQNLQTHVKGLMLTAAHSSVSLTTGLKCPLGSPPADIQPGFDSAGNLRLECLHSNRQHCWSLSGKRGPC